MKSKNGIDYLLSSYWNSLVAAVNIFPLNFYDARSEGRFACGVCVASFLLGGGSGVVVLVLNTP